MIVEHKKGEKMIIEYNKNLNSMVLKLKEGRGWSARKDREGNIYLGDSSFYGKDSIGDIKIKAEFIPMLQALLAAGFPGKQYRTTILTKELIDSMLVYTKSSFLPFEVEKLNEES